MPAGVMDAGELASPRDNSAQMDAIGAITAATEKETFNLTGSGMAMN